MQEPETKAAALQLSGILEFARSHKSMSKQFDTAYKLAPYSSDSRNLAAMFRLYRDHNSPGRKLRPRDVVSDFLAAVALDPRNSLVLANLQKFYELLGTPAARSKIDPTSAIEPSSVSASLAKIKAIRQSLAGNIKLGDE